jgi:hypothetical protein
MTKIKTKEIAFEPRLHAIINGNQMIFGSLKIPEFKQFLIRIKKNNNFVYYFLSKNNEIIEIQSHLALHLQFRYEALKIKNQPLINCLNKYVNYLCPEQIFEIESLFQKKLTLKEISKKLKIKISTLNYNLSLGNLAFLGKFSN